MSASASVSARPLSISIPWYVWCGVAAVTCAMTGVHWDISWHRSIGRDSFWTPAHIDIYFCGVLAGISCGYLILSTTLQPRIAVARIVRDALGIPRTAGRLHRRLGRHRHADLGALRRLVARRLRARRKDPQPAAHGPRRRNDRRANRRVDFDPGADESSARPRARPPASAVSIRRRHDPGLPHGAADGTHLPQPDAHRSTSIICWRSSAPLVLAAWRAAADTAGRPPRSPASTASSCC